MRSTPNTFFDLKALEAVERDIGPRETGIAWHAALQEFVEAYPVRRLAARGARPSPSPSRGQRFALLRADPAFAALHWPNIEKGLDFFLAFERRSRADDRAQSGSSGKAQSPIPLVERLARSSSARGPTESTSCDRAARGSSTTRADRRRAPSEVEVGFAPQLTLEAAMLQTGRISGVAGART